MYKEILLPIDNSRYSDFGIDMGVALAKNSSPISQAIMYMLQGCMITDSNRWSQACQKNIREKRNYRGRGIFYDGLITKGLEIISDSFLDAFEERCRIADIKCSKKTHEGKKLCKDCRGCAGGPL